MCFQTISNSVSAADIPVDYKYDPVADRIAQEEHHRMHLIYDFEFGYGGEMYGLFLEFVILSLLFIYCLIVVIFEIKSKKNMPHVDNVLIGFFSLSLIVTISEIIARKWYLNYFIENESCSIKDIEMIKEYFSYSWISLSRAPLLIIQILSIILLIIMIRYKLLRKKRNNLNLSENSNNPNETKENFLLKLCEYICMIYVWIIIIFISNLT